MVLLKNSFLPGLLTGAMATVAGIPGAETSATGPSGLVLLQGGRSALWRRICAVRIRRAGVGPRPSLADSATGVGCDRHRPVHTRSGAFDCDLYRISSQRRMGCCGCDRSDLSAVVCLGRSAGADPAQTSPFRVDGRVPRLRECVRRSPDGGRDDKAGRRCLTRMADVGHCCSRTGSALEMEDQSGVGSVGRRVGGSSVGGGSMRFIDCITDAL
jgi:hypothetical protein